MKRTNIYLEESQVIALDDLAQARGVSRAELIRQLLTSAIASGESTTLAGDLAAIQDSFGVLRDELDWAPRGPDERSRHLERIARG